MAVEEGDRRGRAGRGRPAGDHHHDHDRVEEAENGGRTFARGQATGVPAVLRPTIGSGTWTIEGDELVQSNDEINATMSVRRPRMVGLRPDARGPEVQGSGHGYQVMFHRLAPRTFAWLGLGVFENKELRDVFRDRREGFEGERQRQGQLCGPAASNVGDWYTIRLEVRKSHFKAYLDGQKIFEGSHKDHTHGRVALNTKEDPGAVPQDQGDVARRRGAVRGHPRDLLRRQGPAAVAGGEGARRAAVQRQGPDGMVRHAGQQQRVEGHRRGPGGPRLGQAGRDRASWCWIART